MTPERYQQVKNLFQSALGHEPAQRSAFLAQACEGDEALYSEVESLIIAHEGAANFIEAPAYESLSDLVAEEPPESIAGRQTGPYKLVREIGEGGMGIVYLAMRADDQYQQQVALKLIKRGMDTDFILRRFLSERQILARLDHPNIAKLLDGGTSEDGLPYLVMDYIEGIPIDQYCDAHKLPTAERLKLFRVVSSAVEYAHQNLVVHRDIKPTNILVTSEGVPKLLDFGIAKILRSDLSVQTLDATATAQRMMTPDYASPEQVRGEQVTTASDVYSLGVLLFELLTGHRPYRTKSRLPHDIVKAICEEEPVKPSTAINRVEERVGSDGKSVIELTPEVVSRCRDGQPDRLRRRLTGDLDNIVLMSMRKEPGRRYRSVDHLSEDLRRHLEGLPVIARKNTFWYRSTKFIKRHKVGVAAALVVAATLVGATIVTQIEARKARAERAKAEWRFNDVRKLANSYMFELHDAIENLPGSTPARELMVKRALEYLDSLASEASGDPSLQRELATAYQKVGDVLGRPGFANLGNKTGALESYLKALDIHQALALSDPMNVEIHRDLATNYDRIGDALRTTGNAVGALESYNKALAIREKFFAADAGTRRDLGNSYDRIGDMLAATGNLVGAVDSQRKALVLREELSSTDLTNAKDRRTLFVSCIKVGDMLMKTGDTGEALESYRRAKVIREAMAQVDKTNAQAHREVAISYDKIGNALAAKGDTSGALESYRKALAIRESLAAADPMNAEMHRDLSISREKIGNMLAERGDMAGALASYRKGLALDEASSAADPKNAQARLDVSIGYEKIGDMQLKSRDVIGALESYHKALAIREALATADPTNADVRRDLSTSYARAGEALVAMKNTAGALESYRKALAIREALAMADPTNADVRRDLASSFYQLGTILMMIATEARTPPTKRKENWNEARSWFQQSLTLYLDLRNRDALSGADSDQPEKVISKINECNASLNLQRN
jgi:serine/threonine protein kinase/tetratricopeptide (TPR) repeat protein